MKKLRSRAMLALEIVKRRGLTGLINVAKSAYSLAVEPDVVPGGPLYVQVEPTIVCNLACSFCINPELNRSVRFMSAEQFEAILDKIPTLEKVSLVGIGEPLLNKDLMSMLRAAKSRAIDVGFTTNGTIMPPRIVEEICEIDPNWLNISLDGATKATFEGIRHGADFDAILKNVERLMGAMDGAARTEVAVWFVGLNENIHELPDLVRLVDGLGIRSLFVQSVHFWGHESWRERNEPKSLLTQLERVTPFFEQARQEASSRGLSLEVCNLPDPQLGRQCQWPWRACYITAEGFITPCCIQGSDPTVINFGNIFEQPFEDIWNSHAYQAFRRELKSPDIPKICEGCTSYYDTVRV
jgi:radical SAM protein with 4Fe4S-binding SPASM domain